MTIFDYDKLDDRAAFNQPTVSPVGIDDVIVNGQLVLAGGKVTGARPGSVLKGACAAPAEATLNSGVPGTGPEVLVAAGASLGGAWGDTGPLAPITPPAGPVLAPWPCVAA